LCDEEAEPLVDEGGECRRPQLTPNTEPVTCVFSPDDHQRPSRSQCTSEAGEGPVARGVEDHVVAAASVVEVFFCVVDHVVCADRAPQRGLLSAAAAGALCPICLRDLHCERPDASTRSDDQNALSRLDL